MAITLAAATTSAETADTTTHTVSLTGIVSGRYLLIVFTKDGGGANPTLTAPSGWDTVVAETPSAGGANKLAVFGRVSDGTEGASVVVTTAGGEKSSHVMMSWSGVDTTTPALDPQVATGNSATPDPPLSNPGVADDYVWIEGFGADDGRSSTAAFESTGYTQVGQETGGGTATDVTTAVAYKSANASSEDPGTMALAGAEQWAAFTLALQPAAAGTPDPDISDADTDETLRAGQTGIAVTGTNLGTTNANRTFSIVQGTVEVDQTETGTGTATAATLSLVMEVTGADLKFGAGTLKVTRDDDATGTLAVTLEPASGELYVDLTSIESTAANRITATPDLAIGDQLHARGVGGGAAPTGLTLNADATFEFSAGNTPTNFEVRAWDASDATWGAFAEQSVGGAVTLSVASCSHGHAADSVTLTQANTLAVADALHGHTAETPALTQANTLAVADASHAQAADSLSLTQAATLAIADALHAHAADALALTQANVLAVNDAAHAQTADGLTLSAGATLAVADALHAQLAESPALVQANILAVDSALHAQSVDSITLGLGLVLEIADALHAHGADNVELTQAGALVVASALHGHTADSVDLLQANVLAIADALHGHTADALELVAGDFLQIADAVHVHTADEVTLTQAHVLVISSALHAHLADKVSLRIPGFVNAPGRVFVVETKNRTFVVTRGNRTFQA